MNVKSCFIVAAGVLLFAQDGLARKWLSSSGRFVEANLESVQGDRVFLKTNDGRTLSIALNELSSGDKLHLKSLERKPEKQLAAATRSLSALPTEQPAEIARPPVTKTEIQEAALSKEVKPGEQPETETQVLRVVYAIKDAQKQGMNLKVYYVSKGEDQKGTQFFGIRSKGGPGGYSNGSLNKVLNSDEVNYTHLDLTLARFIKTEFIGYRVELHHNGQMVAKQHWEDKNGTAALAKRTQLPEDWWYNPSRSE